MALFAWNEKYTVKVEEFDQHHQKLMSLINQLHAYMMQGQGRTVVEPILGELREYTRYHFSAEEMKMARYAFPGLMEHKAQHKSLSERLDTFYERYMKGEEELTIDLFMFLKEWLLRHIALEDKQYGEFFEDKGIS